MGERSCPHLRHQNSCCRPRRPCPPDSDSDSDSSDRKQRPQLPRRSPPPQSWSDSEELALDCNDYPCGWPPSKRPPGSRRKWNGWQWVWPRDKPQHNPQFAFWRRLKDVSKGKGPDIFMATRGSEEPHRPTWTASRRRAYHPPREGEFIIDDHGHIVGSNFGIDYHRRVLSPEFERDARGHVYRRDQMRNSPFPFLAGNRDGKEYDFESRRYRRPKAEHWQDAEWDPDNPRKPVYYETQRGDEWVAGSWDHGYFNAGIRPNPFRTYHRGERWYANLRAKRCHLCRMPDW